MIFLTKAEMIKKWKANYFGLTHYITKDQTEIYIRSDLPDCVKESVIGHELYHQKVGKGNGEFFAWVAGFKANWKGFFLGIIMSLTPSRLKMYPELMWISVLFIVFATIVYFGSFYNG